MKVLFLTPPALDGTRAADRIFGCNYGIYSQPNIFALYPATILKRARYDVTCLDFALSGNAAAKFRRFCASQHFDIIVFHTVFLSKRTDLKMPCRLLINTMAKKYVPVIRIFASFWRVTISMRY